MKNLFDIGIKDGCGQPVLMERIKPQVVKSVMDSDRDILIAIRQLYLDGQNFDLDPCYSTGKFYEDLERPSIKMDKTPQADGVIQMIF